jgi:hypothetical protein
LLQYTCDNILLGKTTGNANAFIGQSAIHEMAKEPRFMRRALSQRMIESIDRFPDNAVGIVRNVSLMPSFDKNKAYVFLQLKADNIEDYENKYRPFRNKLLSIACGVIKNKYSNFTKIVGIAIDSPKYSRRNSEDFLLLNCSEWTNQDREEYERLNKDLKFFCLEDTKIERRSVLEFPE